MSERTEPLRGEPSYYEISLTNRQVVITFVILLTFVLAIFLCGVWVGKNGQARLAQADGAVPEEGAEQPEQLANMEEFKFFSEEAGKDSSAPDLSVLAGPADRPEPTPTRPVREESSPAPAPAPGPAASDPPSAPSTGGSETRKDPATEGPAPQAAAPQAAPPQAAPKNERPEPAPKTEPAATASLSAGFVVQVFSTRDEAQARKVLTRLKNAKHKAFLSAVEVTGQTMYRVRVGPFAERDAADRVAAQVRRQMKLDPWVTAADN